MMDSATKQLEKASFRKPLQLGSRGSTVSLAQSWLLQLGLGDIPASELAECRFGLGTFKAVRKFTGTDSGTLDVATAVSITEKLDQNSLKSSGTLRRIVTGRVTYVDGSPGKDLSVRLLLVNIHDERAETIGNTTANKEGFFSVSFSFNSRQPMTYGLQVEGEGSTLFNTPPGNVISPSNVFINQYNIQLKVPPRVTDLFTRLEAVVVPIRSSDGPVNKKPPRFSHLGPHQKKKELSIISKITLVDYSSDQISSYLVASSLAEIAEDNQMRIPATFFFAQIYGDTYEKVAGARRRNRVGNIRPTTVTSDAKTIFKKICTVDRETLEESVTRAVSANFIAASIIPTLPSILDQLPSQGSSAGDTVAEDVDYFWNVMRELFKKPDGVDKTRAEALLDIATEENLVGQIFSAKGWTQRIIQQVLGVEPSATASQRAETAASVSLPEPLSPTASFTKALREDLNKSDTHAKRRLPPASHSVSESLALTKESLTRSPQTVVASFLKSKARSMKPALTEAEARQLLDFLSSNKDFDLVHSKMGQFLTGKSADAPARAVPVVTSLEQEQIVKKVQRTFRLAPSYEQSMALLNIGVQSAIDANYMGRAQLGRLLASDDAFSPSDVDKISSRAANVVLATSLLISELRSLSSALAIPGVSAPVPRDFLDQASNQMPTLKTLFSLGDICACDECMNVYSPAAYMVDVMHFLRNRQVTGAEGEESFGDLIAGMRPDLISMDLNCANTRTTMPQIDIVCELLEYWVDHSTQAGHSFFTLQIDDFTKPHIEAALSAHLGEQFIESEVFVTYAPGSVDTAVVRYGHHVFLVVKLPQTVAFLRTRQTFGTSAERAASPLHVNPLIYAKLAQSTLLFGLPFNIDNIAGRQYLKKLGVPRETLISLLTPISEDSSQSSVYLAEAFGLSELEFQLITQEALDPGPYWESTAMHDPVNDLQNVQSFLDRTQLTFHHLITILRAGEWLNPDANKVLIHHQDESCSLDKKDLVNLDNHALDRMHRFLRLWRALGMDEKQGWTISAIDRAISVPSIGLGFLGLPLLSSIATINQLRNKIPRSVFIKSVHECIDWFGPLVPRADDPSMRTYESLFLLQRSGLAVPDGFPTFHDNESTTALTVFAGFLAACLAISVDNLMTIVGFVQRTKGVHLATYDSVSYVYSAHSICQTLLISPSELESLSMILGSDPTASPSAALNFAESLATVRASRLPIDELAYLLRDDAKGQFFSGPQLAAYFSQLKSTYQNVVTNSRQFEKSMPLVEKQEATLKILLDTIEFTASEISDITSLKRLIEGELVGEAVSILGDAKVESTLGLDRQKSILKALNDRLQFPGGTQEEDTESLDAFLFSMLEVFSEFILEKSKETARLGFLTATFGLQGGHFLAIFEHVQRVQYLSGDLSSEEDGTLALKLLHKISLVVSRLRIPPSNLKWLLKFGPALGWGNIASLPIAPGEPAVSYAEWEFFQRGHSALTSRSLAPVDHAQNPGAPLTIQKFFEGVLANIVSANAKESSLEYLSKLTSWGMPDDFNAIASQMQIDTVNLMSPLVLARLEDAFKIIRALPSTSFAIHLAKIGDLSSADVQVLQATLQQKFSGNDWLQVLRSIQDPLRLKKRDALVEYSLRTGIYHKSFTHPRHLSGALGIDVEVGTEIQVSRIIEAHLAIQTAVQRLQMGQFMLFERNASETAHTLLPIRAIQDDDWGQWTWMSQYRLWEANRKVFLYPENWLDPELRDDKSRQFEVFEETLNSGDLNEELATEAGEQFVTDITNISKPDIVSMFYEAEEKCTHVFGRIGAGTGSIWHRRLVEEKYWTPWEVVPVPSIANGPFLAFVRNNRLTVAFAKVHVEMDPTQAGVNSQDADDDTAPLRKRFVIRLGISDRDPKTRKWSAERISNSCVYYPPGKDNYQTIVRADINELLVLNYWQVGSNYGECISVRMPEFKSATEEAKEDQFYLGEFALTGPESLPEAHNADYYKDVKHLTARPSIVRTEYLNQRFVLSEAQATNEKEPLTINSFGTSGPHELGFPTTAFNRTYGTFSVIMSPQISKLDLLVWGNQFRHRDNDFDEYNANEDGLWKMPTGSMVPFFYKDNSGRTFILVPGFVYEGEFNPDFSVQPFRSVTSVYDFLKRALELAKTYIDKFGNGMTFNEIKTEVENNKEYKEFLLPEWSKVYGYRTKPGAVSIVQFKMASVYHPLMTQLSVDMVSGGLDRVLSRSSQFSETGFDFEAQFSPAFRTVGKIPAEAINFDALDAYSSYNWELFYHLPFMTACKLSASQKFSEAMTWFHYIFNPRGSQVEPGSADASLAPQASYWITKPFYQTSVSGYAEQLINKILYSSAAAPEGANLAASIALSIRIWRENPFNPHAIARLRPVAFQMTVVLRYIQNLLDWGDHLFRQLTRETLAQATLLYSAADSLLGAKPQTVEPAVKPTTQSLATLIGSTGLFGNAVVDVENSIPNLGDISSNSSSAPTPLLPMYFAVPPNHDMTRYWNLVEDRLFKIRNSLDINGNFISLPLTSPPIDPGAIIRSLTAGSSLQSIIASLSAPLPTSRFAAISDMAINLTGQVVSLGTTLLSVLEKKDGEALARLRAGLEKDILEAVRATKEKTIETIKGVEGPAGEIINGEIPSLELAKDIANERATHYGKLDYMNSREKRENANRRTALGIQILHEPVYEWNWFVSSWRVPDVEVGGQGMSSPVADYSMKPRAQELEFVGAYLGFVEHQVDILNSQAEVNHMYGTFDRRKEEWDFERNQAEAEASRLTNDIEVAKLRLESAKLDLEAHEKEMDKLSREYEFMRSKYTNQELYEWGVKQLSKVYTDTYDLALRMARQAEKAFEYELATGRKAGVGPFVKSSHWDGLKSGLLAGELLQHDLSRMKAAYLEHNIREYELEKEISLQEINPMALLSLRQTGQCMFDVPEAYFDMDTPGHYFRRNRVVNLSLPVQSGQTVAISAKLTLISHRYRASSAVGSGYAEAAGNDSRFEYGTGSSTHTIVTSTNTRDGGFFPGLSEVYRHGASDSRYLPFEFSGAVGTYRIELPMTIQRFDYATITDAIIHLMYTAREGGAPLRNATMQTQMDNINAMTIGLDQKGLRAVFNMSLHAQAAWNSLQTSSSVDVTLPATILPFWARAGGFSSLVKKFTWYAEIKPEAELPLSIELEFSGARLASQTVGLQRVGETGRLYKGAGDGNALPFNTVMKMTLGGQQNSAGDLGLGGLGAIIEFEVAGASGR